MTLLSSNGIAPLTIRAIKEITKFGYLPPELYSAHVIIESICKIVFENFSIYAAPNTYLHKEKSRGKNRREVMPRPLKLGQSQPRGDGVSLTPRPSFLRGFVRRLGGPF